MLYNSEEKKKREKVFTPLGSGWIVYELPDGTVLVEFPHGGGQIFHPQEVFSGPVLDLRANKR